MSGLLQDRVVHPDVQAAGANELPRACCLQDVVHERYRRFVVVATASVLGVPGPDDLLQVVC